jgi:hypothetical protein
MVENRYLLLADGKPTKEGFVESLEKAKTLAAPYIDQNLKLKIERYGGTPAPMLIWRYDYDIEAWVEE